MVAVSISSIKAGWVGRLLERIGGMVVRLERAFELSSLPIRQLAASVRPHVDLARRYQYAAHSARSEGAPIGAFWLLREALHSIAHAYQEEKLHGAELQARLLELATVQLEALAVLPKTELDRRLDELDQDLYALQRPLWPETRRRNWHHALRWKASVLLVAFVAGRLLLRANFGPTNIALNKRVFAVGTGYNTTPYGLVDGRAYNSYGFHSDGGPDRWVTIDLGKKYQLTGAEVFGRHDCCQDQSVPLAVEVSDDDMSYRVVATRTTPFEVWWPWEIKLSAERARFVRVRTLRNTVLVLTEIRLFGRPAGP